MAVAPVLNVAAARLSEMCKFSGGVCNLSISAASKVEHVQQVLLGRLGEEQVGSKRMDKNG